MSFREFVERIRQGNHPDYGTLVWDGETQQLSVTVVFEMHHQEPLEVVRARALKFFEQLQPHEWLVFQIVLSFRAGRPVRAYLKPRTSAVKIGTSRLRELAEMSCKP